MNIFKGSLLIGYSIFIFRLDEDEAKPIIQEIILALIYCWSMNVVHRDLKPENILINGKFIMKLADFGLAKS